MTHEDAVALGLRVVEVIREWKLNLAVVIVLGDDRVFRAKLGSSGPNDNPLLAERAAAARQFGEPSLPVRLCHIEAGTADIDLDLNLELMKDYGGSIPLRVDGSIEETISMSGEPDTIDHQAEAITRYLATATPAT